MPTAVASYDSSDEDEDEDPADCDALVERLAHDDLRRLVASDLADLRLEHGYGSAEIDRLKCVVNKWVAERDAIAAARLEPLLRSGVTPKQVQAVLQERSIFDGIEKTNAELAESKASVPYLEPRVVSLSDEKDDMVVSFSVGDLPERDLQNNANAKMRKRMVEVSERLKTGELYNKLPDGDLSGVVEAAEARFHPRLWRPAADDEEHDLRVPLEFNCDEVETCNSLGVKRSLHKQNGCQLANLSLPPEE